MSAENYDPIMALIFSYEGGYVDNPADSGGPTNMGITHEVLAAWRGVSDVTPAEVQALGKTEAEAIYRAHYWNAIEGDDLPSGIDFATMDAAVNCGPSHGIGWLQQSIGAIADGIVGSKTLAAAKAADASKAVGDICDRRLAYCQGLSTWPTFGKGWTSRIESVRTSALAMAQASIPSAAPVAPGATDPGAPASATAVPPAMEGASADVAAQTTAATSDLIGRLFAWLLGLLRTA